MSAVLTLGVVTLVSFVAPSLDSRLGVRGVEGESSLSPAGDDVAVRDALDVGREEDVDDAVLPRRAVLIRSDTPRFSCLESENNMICADASVSIDRGTKERDASVSTHSREAGRQVGAFVNEKRKREGRVKRENVCLW